jgi:hypothetical protein
MSRYFNFFPKVFYSANNSAVGLETVTSIVSRFGFEAGLKENSAAFYSYEIRDGDTPEIIASKYYDSSERHWIILMFNDIYDPQFDWPLDERTLIKYIDTKYSANGYADTANTGVKGITWAMSGSNVESYFKILTTTDQDGKQTVIKYEVDANTYATSNGYSNTYTLQDGTQIEQTVSKDIRTYYEYETDLNDEKRKIKLLKPEFVPAVEKEFKKVMRA